MKYWGEFLIKWRYLAAATIGEAAGYSLSPFINNLFTPHLLKEFNWSKSDIAFVGVTLVLGIICQPIAGRMTDMFGVKRMAMVGVVCGPLVYFGFSQMAGSLLLFFMLMVFQVVVVSTTTATTTYNRLIAEQFERTRGMALSIAGCAPAVAGAVMVPLLSNFIEANGWRAGCVVVALMTAIVGAISLLLIPSNANFHRRRNRAEHTPAGYGVIVRHRAFQLIILSVVLCNLSYTMQMSQLKVILLDRGVDSATGSWAVSLFAFGFIGGRLLSGVAADRFPIHIVAAVSLGFPGVGLGLLASALLTPMVVATAVVLLGLFVGAEGTILAYLAMRFFKVEIFSTIIGMILSSVALSAGLGAVLLSVMLKLTGSFVPFLLLTAVAALIGSGLLLLLKRIPTDSEC
jgi:MFS family permease